MKSYKIILLLLFLLLASTSTYAFDINAKGYYRLNSDLYKNLNLGTNELNEYRSIWYQKFRIEPDITVSDYVSIKSTLDFFDNELFGANPKNATVSSNPNFYQSTSNGNTEAPEEYEDPATNIYAFSSQEKTGSLILIKRLWAEILTPIGIIKIGRQPIHFGLGITDNSGDDLNSDFGDVSDRISFETGYSGYTLAFGYDKEVEYDEIQSSSNQAASLDSNIDDVTRFFTKAGIDKDDEKLLAQISRRSQPLTSTTEWIFDFYSLYKKSWYQFEAEFVTFQGDTQQKDISAYNWVARNSAFFNIFRFGLEGGFSSGTNGGPTNTNAVRTIAFNRDYNISYLLFEEALPGGASLDTFDTTNTNVAFAENSVGAISNTVYGRAFAGVTFGNIFHIDLNVLNAYALKDPAIGYDPNTQSILFSTKKNYGVEYSFNFGLDVREELGLGFTFAHLIPGSIYDDQSEKIFGKDDANQAWTMQGRVTIRF